MENKPGKGLENLLFKLNNNRLILLLKLAWEGDKYGNLSRAYK